MPYRSASSQWNANIDPNMPKYKYGVCTPGICALGSSITLSTVSRLLRLKWLQTSFSKSVPSLSAPYKGLLKIKFLKKLLSISSNISGLSTSPSGPTGNTGGFVRLRNASASLRNSPTVRRCFSTWTARKTPRLPRISCCIGRAI